MLWSFFWRVLTLANSICRFWQLLNLSYWVTWTVEFLSTWGVKVLRVILLLCQDYTDWAVRGSLTVLSLCLVWPNKPTMVIFSPALQCMHSPVHWPHQCTHQDQSVKWKCSAIRQSVSSKSIQSIQNCNISRITHAVPCPNKGIHKKSVNSKTKD